LFALITNNNQKLFEKEDYVSIMIEISDGIIPPVVISDVALKMWDSIMDGAVSKVMTEKKFISLFSSLDIAEYGTIVM